MQRTKFGASQNGDFQDHMPRSVIDGSIQSSMVGQVHAGSHLTGDETKWRTGNAEYIQTSQFRQDLKISRPNQMLYENSKAVFESEFGESLTRGFLTCNKPQGKLPG